MTSGELVLNAAVLFLVLFRNLGTHPVNRRRFTVPAAIIVVVGFIFLRHVPTAGNDTGFEVIGLVAGIVFGVLAGFLMRVEHTASGATTRAGVTFAALWIVVIVGRVAFSEGATHVYSGDVRSWSIANQISGSGAFTAMFVLMALAMIATMVATLGARAGHAGPHPTAHSPALAGS